MVVGARMLWGRGVGQTTQNMTTKACFGETGHVLTNQTSSDWLRYSCLRHTDYKSRAYGFVRGEGWGQDGIPLNLLWVYPMLRRSGRVHEHADLLAFLQKTCFLIRASLLRPGGRDN